MSDQATALRGLMAGRFAPGRVLHAAPPARRAFAIAITSGKGGVGKSNIALNLAIELARQESAVVGGHPESRSRLPGGTALTTPSLTRSGSARQAGPADAFPSAVCLLDANPGLGNIDLLCGLNGYWNLAHVVTGARTVRDVALAGPAGVQILSGASSLSDLADANPASRSDVLDQLEELEQAHDYLVIDAGTGFQASARRFLSAVDVALIVTTPEPTAIADAYAVIKSVSPAAPARVEVIVNQCHAAPLAQAIVERLAQTSRLFVRMDVSSAGWIPADPDVGRAVARRTPFCLASPQGPAAQASRQLARRLKALAESRPPTEPFFAQLVHRPQRLGHT